MRLSAATHPGFSRGLRSAHARRLDPTLMEYSAAAWKPIAGGEMRPGALLQAPAGGLLQPEWLTKAWEGPSRPRSFAADCRSLRSPPTKLSSTSRPIASAGKFCRKPLCASLPGDRPTENHCLSRPTERHDYRWRALGPAAIPPTTGEADSQSGIVFNQPFIFRIWPQLSSSICANSCKLEILFADPAESRSAVQWVLPLASQGASGGRGSGSYGTISGSG